MDKECFDKDNLLKLFKFLDLFNQNFISKESLLKTFERAGKEINLENVINMMQELDLDPNEVI